jgi:hypothetical protein
VALFACALLAGPLAPTARAGQAPLSFTGANGTYLLITLDQTTSYLVTSDAPGGLFYVFEDVGTLWGSPTMGMGGGGLVAHVQHEEFGFSDTGHTINGALLDSLGGAAGANDLLLFRHPRPIEITAGDVIDLGAGSVATVAELSFPPPAAGMFTTYLVDENNNVVGVPIPRRSASAPSAAWRCSAADAEGGAKGRKTG